MKTTKRCPDGKSSMTIRKQTKFLLLFIIFSALLITCSNVNGKKEEPDKKLLACKYCSTSVTTHSVQFDGVYNYMKTFMQFYHDPKDRPNPSNWGGAFSSGTIDLNKNNFFENDPYRVTVLFPGAEPHNNAYRFFLTYKDANSCDEPNTAVEVCNQMDDLNIVPTDRKAYATSRVADIGWPNNVALPGGSGFNLPDLQQYLRNLRVTLVEEDPVYDLTKSPKSKALLYEMNIFNQLSYSDVSGNQMDDYPSNSFVFSKSNGIDYLLEIPNVTAIGYFWGYDNNVGKEHRLRIILFGIERDSQNQSMGKIAFRMNGAVIDWDNSFRETSSPKP